MKKPVLETRPDDDNGDPITVAYEGSYGYGPIFLHVEPDAPAGRQEELNRIEVPVELLTRYESLRREWEKAKLELEIATRGWDAVPEELMALVARVEDNKEYRENSVRKGVELTFSGTGLDPEIMNDPRVQGFISRVATLRRTAQDLCISKLMLFLPLDGKPVNVPDLMDELLKISPIPESKGR